MVTGEILIRRNWQRRRRSHTIRIWFGIGIASDVSAFVTAQLNPAHRAIANLAERAREFLLVTQNVDDLHRRAGLTPEKMVQIHGDIFHHALLAVRFQKTGG